MELRKALGWGGVQSALRMFIGLVTAKFSATYLGPAGMALVGQVNNTLDGIQGAISVAPNTAVTTLISEAGADQQARIRILGTAIRIVTVISVLIGMVVAAASSSLSSSLLGRSRYWPVFCAMALAVLFTTIESMLIGAVNGMRQVRLISLSYMAALTIGGAAQISLVSRFGLWGAFFGLMIMYSIRLPVTGFVVWKSALIRLRHVARSFDRGTAVAIVSFYPMLLANTVAQPIGQLTVRSAIVGYLGLEQAGYVQAAWRISDMYVGVLTTALGLFYMAHYASLRTDVERAKTLRRVVGHMSLLTFCAAVLVYMSRNLIIHIVLTDRFRPMAALLPLQLAGDVARMTLYPLHMTLASQRRTIPYAVVAVGIPLVFAALTYSLLPVLGLRAAPAAYLSANVIFLAVVLLFQRRLMTLPSP